MDRCPTRDHHAVLRTSLSRCWISILSFIPHDMMYGPQAALIAECFSPRLRYSVSSLGYHLASVVTGGPVPIIATALLAATISGYLVALYIFACAVVSVVTTAMLPDYANQDISQEAAYDGLADPAVEGSLACEFSW